MAWLPICIQISLVPGHTLNSLLARERFVSYVRKDGKRVHLMLVSFPDPPPGLRGVWVRDKPDVMFAQLGSEQEEKKQWYQATYCTYLASMSHTQSDECLVG